MSEDLNASSAVGGPEISDPGPIPVLPTVFDPEGRVVPDAVARPLDFVARCGLGWACLPAFGSEFYKLQGDERERLITAAIGAAGARVRIIVQCNHPYAPAAAELAARAADLGASMVATALPRNFPASEAALIRHAITVARATPLPVVLQDWNPVGASLPAAALAAIARECPNVTFIKLEEPGIADKVRAVRELAGLRVLTGWGGLYLLEQLPAGIAGLMPGLPLLDVFATIWRSWLAGEESRAFRLYALVLPYIHFSLRNLEQFHHCEKALAQRRGLIDHAAVREPTIALDPAERRHLDRVIDLLLEALATEGFDPCPLAVP